MDAILSLATTQLVDRIMQVRGARHPAARDDALATDRLSRSQKRDILLLAACYDQSTAENRGARWHQLRRKLGFNHWLSKWDWAVGIGVTLVTLVLIAVLGQWGWLATIWPYLLIAAGWGPRLWNLLRGQYRAWRIARSTKVLNQTTSVIRRILANFTPGQLVGQPLPQQARSDDRYELLVKLQDVLRTLGFDGLIVLVDRVDEPYLINGSTELMKLLVWPLLDNKLLKHPGLGTKVLLPIELERIVDREGQEFQQRARLDKQNMIRGLPWTGQSLYDVAVARIKACASDGASPSLTAWFESAVGQKRLVDAFAQLRVPRNLFKFMYRLLTTHCNAHSDDQPEWQISSGTFESVLALYQRDQDAFDRGVGAG